MESARRRHEDEQGRDEQGRGGAATGLAEHEPSTQQLSLAATSDRCANCGAPLASDQRYCINCGERRGKPRFTLAAPATTEVVTTRTAGPRQWVPRPTSGASLIAGIATLLLAMGVGVLIGHNSSTSTVASKAPAYSVVTVGGSGAGSAGSAASAGGVAAGGGAAAKKPKSSSVKAAAKAANSKAPPPPVVIKKAAAAATKVVGNANVAPVTVTQGGSCASGQAGCSGGKFTGNFFGQ